MKEFPVQIEAFRHFTEWLIMGTMHIRKKTTHGYIILEFERFIELFVYRNAALVSSLA